MLFSGYFGLWFLHCVGLGLFSWLIHGSGSETSSRGKFPHILGGKLWSKDKVISQGHDTLIVYLTNCTNLRSV